MLTICWLYFHSTSATSVFYIYLTIVWSQFIHLTNICPLSGHNLFISDLRNGQMLAEQYLFIERVTIFYDLHLAIKKPHYSHQVHVTICPLSIFSSLYAPLATWVPNTKHRTPNHPHQDSDKLFFFTYCRLCLQTLPSHLCPFSSTSLSSAHGLPSPCFIPSLSAVLVSPVTHHPFLEPLVDPAHHRIGHRAPLIAKAAMATLHVVVPVIVRLWRTWLVIRRHRGATIII